MSIPASKAREKLFPLIKQVNDDQEPILITSNSGNAVLISEKEWESIVETEYLLGDAKSRAILLEARAQLQKSKKSGIEFKGLDTLNDIIAKGKSKRTGK